MEKTRKTKVIAILALVVAVVGMSLGFAAFSNILTISSSATVTPNDEDFKMKIMGFNKEGFANDFLSDGSFLDDSNYSDITAVAMTQRSGLLESGENATIDNVGLKITGLKANFINSDSEIYYLFKIKNDGKYVSYLNLSDYGADSEGYFISKAKSCVAGEGTSPSLVNTACDGILLRVSIFDSNFNTIDWNLDSYEIPVNDYIFLGIGIDYNVETRADGPFTVSFDDLTLDFSTAK